MRSRSFASDATKAPDASRPVAAEAEESGVAMLTTLIMIMLTATLSMIMLAVMMNEVMPTSYLQTSSQTIFAAEAGIDAVLGQVRTAVGPPTAFGTYGDRTKLPCTAAGPVGGVSGDLRYEAVIQYYANDPTTESEAWRDANDITCIAGTGPSLDPTYALVTSTGIGLPVAGTTTISSDRIIQAVYEFQVTNNNIPGGLMYNFDGGNASLSETHCLQAESATAGSYVRYAAAADCGTDDIRQLWIYANTYQLKLASTTIPSLAADELCITRPSGGALPQRITLEVCMEPTDSARWTQLYSWEGGAKFNGENSTITNYANVYLSAGATSMSTGSYLQAWGTAPSNAYWGSFRPDPRVGAGAASYVTHQIVNYLEFGRCYDVTGEQVTYPFMIVYPCKQDPSGGALLKWNHKWYYTEPAGEIGSLGPQQIYLYSNTGTKYCLRSAGTEGGYVTLTSSCSVSAVNQQWTRFANTGDYATSYTFVDGYGRCSSLGPPGEPTGLLRFWSTIVTSTCNAGLGQKWNAPPSAISASVGGYQEIS